MEKIKQWKKLRKRKSWNKENNGKRVLPKELATGSTVYSRTFFNAINRDWSIQVPEDSQHGILYWPFCSKVSIYRRVSMCFPLHGLFFFLFCFFVFWGFFSLSLVIAKPCLADLSTFTKTDFCVYILHSSENVTWFALRTH